MGSVDLNEVEPASDAGPSRRTLRGASLDTFNVLTRRYPLRGIETVLLIAFVLLFALPSRLVYLPLGAEGRPATLLGLGLFFVWCLGKLVPHLAPRGRQPLRIALWVYVGALLLSWLAGLDRGPLPIETLAMDRTVMARLSVVGLALVMADGVRTRRSLDRLLVGLMYCGGFMGLVAFLQFALDIDIVPSLKFPPFAFNAELVGSRVRGAGVRVSSTAGHSIELGVVAAMLLPIAHHYVLRAGSNNQRIFRLVAAGLLVASLTFAGSRAGFVGLAVVGLTLAWGWSTRARFQGLILMVFGLVAFKALLPGLMGTIRYLFLNFGSDDSITGRTDDYEVIFDYIRTRPILGRGPGTFVPDQYIVLDNEYLYSAVTIGLVGLFALAAIAVVALMQAGWVAHHAGTNETRHLGQALKASILVGVVASATFDSMSFATFSSVWFIVLGAAAALWRIERDGTDTDIDPKARSDFSQVVVSGRLTDPSAGHRSVLQTVNDHVEERAAR